MEQNIFRTETEKPDYQTCDEQLDRLLALDLEKDFIENWLGRLYRCRSGIGPIFFMKLAGVSAKDISATLHMPIERVYYMEYRIVQHFRFTRQNYAHQRFRRASRRPIRDYYKANDRL